MPPRWRGHFIRLPRLASFRRLFAGDSNAKIVCMIGIRAHIDGSVVVPDEPMAASPQTQVVVLFESANGESTSELETATRQYYEALASQDSEDDSWGEGVARDSGDAWDQE